MIYEILSRYKKRGVSMELLNEHNSTISIEKQQEIFEIIQEPWHGSEFYSEIMFHDLILLLENIFKQLTNAPFKEQDPIILVNNFVKSSVKVRKQYFEKFSGECEEFFDSEKIYRTGYAALCRQEAMCAGYAEATRMLLALFNIPSYTLLAKLPGANKRLLHYLVVAEDDLGNFRILDPERESSCERKGYNFEQYLDKMNYILPDTFFSNNKIGPAGVGECALEFLKRETTISAEGMDGAYQLAKMAKERKQENVYKIERIKISN